MISGSGSPAAVARGAAPRAAGRRRRSSATATVCTPSRWACSASRPTRPPAAESATTRKRSGVAQHHVDGLGADGPGGAEDHDVAGAVAGSRRDEGAVVRVCESVRHGVILSCPGRFPRTGPGTPPHRRRPCGAGRPGAGAVGGRSADGPVDVVRGGRAGGGVGDPGALAARVDDALLQPAVPSRPGRRADSLRSALSVLVHSRANSSSTRTRACRQKASASWRASGPWSPVARQVLGAYAGGAHREQLGADVDDPGQEVLLELHPALPAGHGVEGAAGELAGGPLDVPQVAGERAELGVGGGQLARSRRPAWAASGRRSRRPSRPPSPCRTSVVSGSMRSPATDRWASTASRAISRCMISVEPSKIRLIRRSRSICSAGTARSPRAASESAVSKPRPPRICTSSSAIRQAVSEP